MNSVRLLSACALALLSAACSDGGLPLPFPIGLQTPDAGPKRLKCSDEEYTIAPSLTDIQAKVFSPSCALGSCHGGDTPEADLDLNEGNSHASLVGRASDFSYDGGPMITLVVPGDPGASFLMDKLTMTDAQLQSAGCPDGGNGLECDYGRRMPFNNPPLCDKGINAIRQWIEAGAPNN